MVEGSYYWAYYFACHTSRSLFWVHEHEISHALDSVLGTVSPSHLKHVLEKWYWTHCRHFPCNQQFTKEIALELTSILVHHATDQVMAADSSVILISGETLQVLLSLAERVLTVGFNDYTIVVVSRLLETFAHARFINYHGQVGARLGLDYNIYRGLDSPRSSMLGMLLSVFLFSMPHNLVDSLDNLYIGSFISYLSCDQFTQEIRSKWQNFIIIATVLLTTNVAFLAIPSVDRGVNERTPAQIASYISLVMSMICITSGGLLVHLIHTDVHTFVKNVWYFPKTRAAILPLATLYSIPYASLCWGFITFLLAFSLECFSTQDLASIVLVAIALGLLAFFMAWCIYVNSRQRALSESVPHLFHSLMKNIYNLITRFYRSFIRSSSLLFGLFQCRISAAPRRSSPDGV